MKQLTTCSRNPHGRGAAGELVGLDPRNRTLDSYPTEPSGGQRRARDGVATALTRDPEAHQSPTKYHYGSRRDRAEAGHRPVEQAAEGAGLRDGVREPRPGARRRGGQLHHGHVRRPGGRTGSGIRHPVPSRARIHPRSLGFGAVHRSRRNAPAPGARRPRPSRCSPKDFPEGDRFTPRSSHPDKVSQLRPVLKRVSDSDHYYAELPDSELKRLGIKPYVPGGAIRTSMVEELERYVDAGVQPATLRNGRTPVTVHHLRRRRHRGHLQPPWHGLHPASEPHDACAGVVLCVAITLNQHARRYLGPDRPRIRLRQVHHGQRDVRFATAHVGQGVLQGRGRDEALGCASRLIGSS